MILCQMDIKLLRRENGHLKGILIFMISFLMWHFTDTAVVFFLCLRHKMAGAYSVTPFRHSAHYLSHTWRFLNDI